MTASTKPSFAQLHQQAHQAGMAAVSALTVQPMIVQDANLDGSPKAGGKQWFVADGVCGFAWVNVKPNKPGQYAHWAAANGLGYKDSYAGGVTISVQQFNQSMQKKEAYAYAYADTLKAAGVTAYAASRMD